MSKVNRSTYQKSCELNKKLRHDIKVLVMDPTSLEGIELRHKWKKRFMEEKLMNQVLRVMAKMYLEKHPEFDITSPLFNPLGKPKGV